ncbi:alpha/beta hydrolase [Acinetobacter sp. SWBY1]|uniref:alpha/beta hydrolase n=1 Tax=Acinetobacter sp. SWBY1 TaxID=2079596 RepID=UPI000CF1EABA|nr:alpha/beta fold hydrolase [Acinetobacter sp. SWBY1]AVH48954.1 triacylglycerol lipase [Acinetobacter sp. SWBY1]
MKKIWLSVALASSSLFLTACNDDHDDTSVVVVEDGIPKYNFSAPVVKTEPYLDQGANANNVLDTVSASKTLMTYKMLGVNGQETQATALVFTPQTVKPAGGWPLVVWAHGTTGVADACAPSRQGLNGNEYFIAKLLAAGYAVVAPDYEGLGEPSGKELHPFLNLKSAAYSITDAVVAASKLLGNTAETRWSVVGHSQGGHAALGAAQYASRAQLNYKGAIAIAPASNLGLVLMGGEQKAAQELDLIKKVQTLAPLDTFTALITAGLRNTAPTLQYSEIFATPTDQLAALAETDCYETLGQKLAQPMIGYAQTYGTLDGYQRTQPNFMTTIPEVKDFLANGSQPLKVKITTPIFIYQGTADPTVPKQATDLLVQTANNLGTKIHYVTDQDLPIEQKWDHGSVYVNNLDEFVKDVQSLMPIQ